MLGEQGSDERTIGYQRDRMGRLVGAVLEEQSRRVTTLFERDVLGRETRRGDVSGRL